MSDDEFLDLAASVADGGPVDWATASQTIRGAEDRRLFDGLRLVADVTGGGMSLPSPASSPEDEAELHGQWGPLFISARVGRGTFGDVYRAWDPKLDREVALKILRRGGASDAAGVSSVIEEGRLLARVRHPNVVTAYGADRIDGRVGLWMEFVDGETLEQEVRRDGPLPLDRVIQIAIDLGDALAAVHRAGLLHRDVKAHNVVRGLDGRLLLTDFGAGERFDSRAPSGDCPIGTPLYAAPEVIRGAPATTQSDIYSLGVLLYHLATGRYPVEGGTLEAIRSAHEASRRTALRSLRPDVPEAIEAAIDRALRPDPGGRYASADTLRATFAALAGPAPRPADGPPPAARAGRTWRHWLAAAATLVTLAGGATALLWPEPAPLSLAVLPLRDLGSDPAGSEFADGLTDELIRQLTMVHGLDVRSRTSSFAARNWSGDLREAGAQLQVGLLLEGSVRRSAERVRITAQLLKVADESTIWAGTFDRNIKDLLAIQDEISRAIVSELRLTLNPGVRPPYTPDIAIYEQYLRARSLSERKDRESLRTAIAFYKEVVAREPRFAPAYAGLADAYADLEFWGANYEASYGQIQSTAAKAIELDPLLAEAYAAMGLVHARDRRWADAEEAFRRSIDINPNLSRTRTAYAFWVLFQTGRVAEALEELQIALTHDPLSLDVRRVLAYVQLSAGQYAAALENCRRVLKEDPTFPLIRLVQARALLLSGDRDGALRVLEPMPPNRAPELGYAYAVVGRHAEAEALAELARGIPLTQAVIYAGLEDPDRAFAALERAAADRDPRVGGVTTYPELAILREDPRFAAFRQHIGLPRN